MSIRVKCPNRHVLQAKDSLAGKICLCPKCKARVKVPGLTAKEMTDSAIIGIIGQPEKSVPARGAASQAASAVRVRSASTPKKTCPHCEREIPTGHHICPYCRTYIAGLGDF